MRFFLIDPAGAAAATQLTEVTAVDQQFLFNPDREAVDEGHSAYGLSVWQLNPGETYAVVTQEGATTIATARPSKSTNAASTGRTTTGLTPNSIGTHRGRG